jgi:hypothetical protein
LSRAIVLAAGLGALVGCAGAEDSALRNVTGTGGSSGICTGGCPPVGSLSSDWRFEIDPPGSSAAGITVTAPPAPASDGSLQLTADSQMPVTATFTAPMNLAAPSPGTIILTVPSPISGRPALNFQTPVMSSGNVASGSLQVPSKMVAAGGTATLSLVPLPPADQQSPPYTTTVILGPTLPTTPIATDTFAITGVLETAIGAPPSNSFVARAFQQNAQVSSAPLTSTKDGSFQLLLPPSVTAAGGTLTIQLTPQTQNDAWFVFPSISLPSSPPLGFDLGTVLMSAYATVNQFNLLVEGMADQMPVPVTGASVQAQTKLGSSIATGSPNDNGTTNFSRTGMTDATGVAALSLLPGNGNAPVDYNLVIVPASGSPYATGCFTSVGVGAGASGVTTTGAPVLGPFLLPSRAVMSGQITDSSGRGVASVAIKATPGSGSVSGCTSTSAAPATTITDSQGKYTLPLDPGQFVSYQLDYDPPAGSAAPRLTEGAMISVSNSGSITHDVRLPAGELIEGVVSDSTPASAPVPSATVRLFGPQCSYPPCPSPPPLLGQGVTDANGNFQIVIAPQ